MTQRLELKAQITAEATGEITGIAWPYGSEDRVGDVIQKGAFASTASLPILWAHDQAEAIGVWDQITDTPDGLRVKGRLLVDDVAKAREVHALIRAGAVTGLSVGFVTKSSQPRGRRGRTITAAELHEISVVAVPCHPGAQITAIKANPTIENGDQNPMEDQDLNPAQETPKVANAPQIDTKALDKITQRLDQLEAKAQRPGVTTTGPVESAEQKAFGSYLRRGAHQLDDMDRKALTVSANANGGFLVPAEYASELLKLLREKSPIRQYARVMQVEASEIIFPRKVSGTAAVWTDEGDDMTESGMTFEQVKIANHELSTFVIVSNKLIEDNAYALEGELLADFSEDFAAKEAVAFLKGDGIGKPRGILTATGITEVKTGVAASFPAANPADVLIGMFHAIPTLHAHNGVWMMNRATLATVRTWKTADGRYLVIDPQDGAPSQLLGRPVVEVPDMDNIGAGNVPILFGDLSGYRIVDRVGLSVLHDPFTLGTKSQVRFIARRRVGGDVTNPDRFVKLKVAA
ncbi:MAG TPA: phage major capsid protein [Paracoccus solventivorans]|uniref:Phage major capsid protein n=1 Tax=Paracoccus solventivorans TaxID=53463 RepID=A0A832PMD7_9RHOB|nr:phage major capsid protein [Paracoccus solventivorans]HHW34343.1 phage major capsid protein [Paracoccus solventivorans]